MSWYFKNKSYVKDAITQKDIDVYVEAYRSNDKMRNGFNYYRAFTNSAKYNKQFENILQVPILAIADNMRWQKMWARV